MMVEVLLVMVVKVLAMEVLVVKVLVVQVLVLVTIEIAVTGGIREEFELQLVRIVGPQARFSSSFQNFLFRLFAALYLFHCRSSRRSTNEISRGRGRNK